MKPMLPCSVTTIVTGKQVFFLAETEANMYEILLASSLNNCIPVLSLPLTAFVSKPNLNQVLLHLARVLKLPSSGPAASFVQCKKQGKHLKRVLNQTRSMGTIYIYIHIYIYIYIYIYICMYIFASFLDSSAQHRERGWT